MVISTEGLGDVMVGKGTRSGAWMSRGFLDEDTLRPSPQAPLDLGTEAGLRRRRRQRARHVDGSRQPAYCSLLNDEAETWSNPLMIAPPMS